MLVFDADIRNDDLASIRKLTDKKIVYLLSSHASLRRSREILIVAQYQHRALVEAVGARHGARAEEVAREHARLAKLNLELVLEDRGALARFGVPLLLAI